MLNRDEWVKLFKELNEEAKMNIWYRFVDDNNDDKTLHFYNDCIYEKKDFWEMSEQVYRDDDGDDWASEIARRVQLSPNYNPDHKYIRDSWDEEAEECRMLSSDSVIDLIRVDNGTPLYDTDVFVVWFSKFVMKKLNNYKWTLLGEE